MRRILPVVLLAGLCAASLPEAAEAKKKYRCRGRLATIVGTKHADRITGTKKKDVIVGPRLQGRAGGSATGTGHVAADENPVDIAQKCSGSGLATAHLDLDLATTPSISG